MDHELRALLRRAGDEYVLVPKDYILGEIRRYEHLALELESKVTLCIRLEIYDEWPTAAREKQASFLGAVVLLKGWLNGQ